MINIFFVAFDVLHFSLTWNFLRVGLVLVNSNAQQFGTTSPSGQEYVMYSNKSYKKETIFFLFYLDSFKC